jgi:aspartate kinase
VDIRKSLKTDNNYREAKINFELSAPLIKKAFTGAPVIVTQGFIGSTANNLTTTLGREGSDYTAALLAYFLDASSVTVWKDVPGVLNADPKWFDNTVKLERLSYMDAIELAFYGASVIHPKTIQPLKKKNIPLLVRSFKDPDAEGTVISETTYKKLIPCYIFKVDQVLIDIYPADLTFIAEENLKYIFSILAKHGMRINLMQNTAVSFRICVNNDTVRIPAIINELTDKFQVRTQRGLELITIRYYDQETVEKVTMGKEIILEQHTEDNILMVVKNTEL